MAVAKVDMFSDENLSDKRDDEKGSYGRDISIDNWEERQVVDLDSICHVSDALSDVFVAVRDYYHLVSSLDQALGQLIAVGLNSSKFWGYEVGD